MKKVKSVKAWGLKGCLSERVYPIAFETKQMAEQYSTTMKEVIQVLITELPDKG